MQYKSAAFIVASLAAQQVAAGGWTDASSYSCPSNTNNHCSDSQQGGYDWGGLNPGSFDSYGSNKFKGFQCSNNFGKRDLLSKRGFQSKCITGNLDDQPSMSCGDDDSMTIDEMQISSSHDADIDCEYGMPDGSTCHETHSCSEGGSVFKNTQCGGAKSVTFKPGKNAPSGCSIGVHHVGFHCGPPASSVPPYQPPSFSSVAPSSSAPPASSAPCYGKDCSSAPAPSCSGKDCGSSTAPVASSVYSSGCWGKDCSSAPISSSAVAPPCYGKDCSSSAMPVTSSSAPCYGKHCGGSSAPAPSCYGKACSSSAPAPPGCYGKDCSSAVQPSSSAPAPPCYGKDCSSSAKPVTSSYPAPPCYGKDCSSAAQPSSSAPAPPCYGKDCSSAAWPSSSAPAPPCYGKYCSSAAQPSSSAPAAPCYGKDCSSAAWPSSSAPAPPCYGKDCSSAVQPSSSAPAPPCYGKDCSSSAVPASSSWGSYSQSIPVYGSSSSHAPVSSASSSPPNYPTPNCPGLLPRCLNTWMYMSGCKDNADSDCFCGNEAFIKNVMDCISAWGSESETQAAASYLMGLCAAHVPSNPAIITACPIPTVKPGPSPADYTSSSVPGAVTSQSKPHGKPSHGKPGKPAPCTTITYSATAVVPATYSTGVSAGYTCPGSSYTTQLVTTVTVPAVHLTTHTITSGGTTSCSVGLGGGAAPSSAPAYTTGPAPASSAGAHGSSAPAPAPYGTTFGTSWAAPSASGSQIPVVPATGAGVKISSSVFGWAFGAIAALAAL